MLMVSSRWYYHFRCVWPGMAKLPKIKSFLFLCNMLRKKWVKQLIFCMQIKHESLLQIDTKIFWWGWSSIPKVAKFAMSLQYLKKEVRDEFEFLDADKHQSFLKVDFNTLDIKVSYKGYYHYWWAWSSILKVLKATSL